MSRNSSQHTGKSRFEKEYYNNYIKKQESESTVDEGLEFKNSDSPENEYSVAKVEAQRPIPIKYQIYKHLKEKWIEYAVIIFIAIISWLMVYSRIDIATILEKLSNVEKRIDKVEIKVEENKDYNHQQDLKIQKNELNIQNSKKKDD